MTALVLLGLRGQVLCGLPARVPRQRDKRPGTTREVHCTGTVVVCSGSGFGRPLAERTRRALGDAPVRAFGARHHGARARAGSGRLRPCGAGGGRSHRARSHADRSDRRDRADGRRRTCSRPAFRCSSSWTAVCARVCCASRASGDGPTAPTAASSTAAIRGSPHACRSSRPCARRCGPVDRRRGLASRAIQTPTSQSRPAARSLPAHHSRTASGCGGVLPSPDLRVGRQSRAVRTVRALQVGGVLAVQLLTCPWSSASSAACARPRQEELLLQREIDSPSASAGGWPPTCTTASSRTWPVSMALTALHHSATARGVTPTPQPSCGPSPPAAVARHACCGTWWWTSIHPTSSGAACATRLAILLETVRRRDVAVDVSLDEELDALSAGDRGGALPFGPGGGPHVVEHAGASRIDCASKPARRATFAVCVADDGRGFVPGHATSGNVDGPSPGAHTRPSSTGRRRPRDHHGAGRWHRVRGADSGHDRRPIVDDQSALRAGLAQMLATAATCA